MAVVTIDGSSGTGKSTVAVLVARAIDAEVVDTGRLLRALTAHAIAEGIDTGNARLLAEVVRSIETVNFSTSQLYSAHVESLVSIISEHPEVQRELARRIRSHVSCGRVYVIEGRSTGVDLFPNADLKIFLTADILVRAQRKKEQTGVTLNVQSEFLRSRDERDSDRKVNPMRAGGSALVIDTTDKTPENVADIVIDAYQSSAGSTIY